MKNLLSTSTARFSLLLWIILLMAAHTVSCSTPTTIEPLVPVTGSTSTSPPVIQTNQPAEQPGPTVPATIIPTATIPNLKTGLPLSKPGEYFTGRRGYSFVDTERKSRKINITVWYPAIRPDNPIGNFPLKDAEPDLSGAPYPLIICSTKIGNIFAPHMASYGFVVAGVNDQDSYFSYGEQLVDYPKDQLFMLNQIGAGMLNEMNGIVDAGNTGAMGYSFDGYNALALSGARVDPVYYLEKCKKAGTIQPPLPEWWIKYICALKDSWDEFSAYAGTDITTSENGLWQPMTDPRIKAVMPMAPEGAWLFGDRGLSGVDRPVLMIGAQLDEINYYYLETAFIFEHLGVKDKTLITFMDEGHMMIGDTNPVEYMKHFAIAFFGFHLQGREDYKNYISEAFIKQFPKFFWGVYPAEE